MGIEQPSREPIRVKDVSPREVYFQAATLYTKTSRLMFEFTNKEGENVEQMKIDAHPADVMRLLHLAEKNLAVVVKKLNIQPSNFIEVSDEEKTPTQVFQTIVELNRRANNLLDFRFSPSNAHQKITEAIAVAAAILESKNEAKSVFYPDTLEKNVRPKDVYIKMAIMYDAMSSIMKKLGKKCLVLDKYEKNRSNVLPSDVYDLAVMFVSQLRYMHSLMPEAKQIKNSYYPGKVIPADVYQRLSILEKQMLEMKRVSHIISIDDKELNASIAK